MVCCARVKGYRIGMALYEVVDTYHAYPYMYPSGC